MISFVSTSSSLIIIALLPSLKTPIMLIFVPTKISLLSFFEWRWKPAIIIWWCALNKSYSYVIVTNYTKKIMYDRFDRESMNKNWTNNFLIQKSCSTHSTTHFKAMYLFSSSLHPTNESLVSHDNKLAKKNDTNSILSIQTPYR